MTSVRLPSDIEEKLQMLSISRHKSKSDIIKEALELLLRNETQEKDSYELGQDLFGKFGSGGVDRDYKTRVKDKIRAKYNSH